MRSVDGSGVMRSVDGSRVMAEPAEFLMQSFEVPEPSSGHYVQLTPVPAPPSGYDFSFCQTASFVVPSNGDGCEPIGFRTMAVAVVWWQRRERRELDPYVRRRARELGWSPPEDREEKPQ
jgi:hypothetical protein